MQDAQHDVDQSRKHACASLHEMKTFGSSTPAVRIESMHGASSGMETIKKEGRARDRTVPTHGVDQIFILHSTCEQRIAQYVEAKTADLPKPT